MTLEFLFAVALMTPIQRMSSTTSPLIGTWEYRWPIEHYSKQPKVLTPYNVKDRKTKWGKLTWSFAIIRLRLSKDHTFAISPFEAAGIWSYRDRVLTLSFFLPNGKYDSISPVLRLGNGFHSTSTNGVPDMNFLYNPKKGVLVFKYGSKVTGGYQNWTFLRAR